MTEHGQLSASAYTRWMGEVTQGFILVNILLMMTTAYEVLSGYGHNVSHYQWIALIELHLHVE